VEKALNHYTVAKEEYTTGKAEKTYISVNYPYGL